MTATPIVSGLYQVSLGMVNVFLVDTGEVTLIDTGIPGSAPKILDAVREIGRQPRDLKRIVITHPHMDHVGSVNELREATGAAVCMHALDAEAYEKNLVRTVEPAPGLLNKLVVGMMMRTMKEGTGEGGRVDRRLADGEELPGGLRVIHAPGHTAGHIVLLWPKDGGVLICGDALSHMLRLGYSFLYEDFAQGRRTLGALSNLPFETALFSHGKPVKGGAAAEFRKKFC